MPRILFLAPILIAVAGGMYMLSPSPLSVPPPHTETILGESVKDLPIHAYHFGNGEEEVVVIGGIHGGYEWNTSLLGYELIEHFKRSPASIPQHVRLTVIPVANPDGLRAVAGTTTDLTAVSFPQDAQERAQGRFNANGVDLNRNFDCNWQEKSTWGTQEVSAGSAPFSEPEAQALQRFITKTDPSAVIFLHSKANAVYGSECEEGVLNATKELLQVYAGASGYTPIERFDSYPITGDAEGWLASLGIPAITVELKDHEDTEFEKNLNGVEAVMGWVSTP